VVAMVSEAQEDLRVIQSYHYPMVKFDLAVIKAVKRGIRPLFLTSGQRDQPVFKNIFNYMLFQRLILKSVSVHETKERLLHSKVYLTDGQHINLGSMNNDRWSWRINNEVNLAIRDPRDYQWLTHYMDFMMAKGRLVSNNYTLSVFRAASILFWQYFLYYSEMLMSRRGKPEEDFVRDPSEIPEEALL
jgi:phosphatidylserine/phosphatidylglycerophosphate/cardiolipin synthase-like enzyme